MSTEIPINQLALVLNDNHKPEVITIPVVKPKDNQVLIKTQAFAINPTDWKHITGRLGETNSIVGCDASGIVVEVGSKVESLKVGDNVSTFLHGAYKAIPYPGAFCEYAIGFERTTYKYDYELAITDGDSIPVGSILSYEGAASVSLALVTVAYSFYYSLGLDKGNDYSTASILIWSGSTSVGSFAIQVAKWLGFKNVVVTCSPDNNGVMKQYGATHTFDYKDFDVVKKIKATFGEDITYALDCFSTTETFNQVYKALSDTKPSHLDNLLFLGQKDIVSENLKETNVEFGNTLAYPAMGEDSYFGESVYVPASLEMLKRYDKFHFDFQEIIDSKKLLHIPIKIFPKGLYGVIDALTYLKEGYFSNKKFVLRMNDTP